ncbi:hypothetical protein [Streptomyces sp. G45]|uniref:hypothetical protein n=1 Tax=Streptomyces sp. G45 TaxID=3406627 RepID=UPI003C22269A
MARKPKMSQEDRRAYAVQMRAELESIMDRAYGAMVVSQEFWAEVLRTGATLTDRSPINVVAVAAQLPGATRILSSGDWRKVGRYPAKGSTSIRIWTPIKRRPVETSDAAEAPSGTEQAPAETSARKVSGYKAGPVFDLSQTDGDDYQAPAAVTLPVDVVRDTLAAQYREMYGEDPEAAEGFDGGRQVPDHAARILLYGHAWRRIAEVDAPMPGQHAAEVASAAHVAALMLGITPGEAVMPPLAGIVTGDKKPPVHGAVIRVIETGRAIADAVMSGAAMCPAVADSDTRNLVTSG